MDLESKNVFARKLRFALFKADMSYTDLSKLLGYSLSNVSRKIAQNNFTERDMRIISEALGYDIRVDLVSKDTGEELQIPEWYI